VLRPAERRWTKAELDARIAAAPPFSFGPPTPERLEALVAGYVRLTGDPVGRSAKRNFLAACFRMHGEDTLGVIAERYRVTGTITNLLGAVRCLPRRTRPTTNAAPGAAPLSPIAIQVVSAPRRVPAMDRTVLLAQAPFDCGCPLERLLPDLVYCRDHVPAFDGRDERRHDRRASNPEAARFFELPPMAARAGNRDARADTPW
jgi:hypothetical protein